MKVSMAYNRIAVTLIKQTQNLNLFGICGGNMLEGLASWARNWTLRLAQGEPICQAGIWSQVNASNGMKVVTFPLFSKRAEPDQAWSRLMTHGLVIDTVAATNGLKFDYVRRYRLGIGSFMRLQQHFGSPKDWFSKGKALERIDDGRVMRALLADGAFVHSRHPFDGDEMTQSRLTDLASLLDAMPTVMQPERTRAEALRITDDAEEGSVRQIAQAVFGLLVCDRVKPPGAGASGSSKWRPNLHTRW